MADAKEALAKLTDADWQELAELNQKIQNHKGAWGETKGGEQVPSRTDPSRIVTVMPYIENNELINEFIQTIHDKGLILEGFDWKNWHVGKLWMEDDRESKYELLNDKVFTVKLITALVRQDRFAEGSIKRWFELGVIQKVLGRLLRQVNAA
ncbi:MAG TPA: DUF6508 domain-containing protein [Candidatus Saccharimonadaceae bacterium]|nr:DUF6508 domain-containing protein [Candidatus Saccharimonadaceae bacterium]